jgi:hypothetical protein
MMWADVTKIKVSLIPFPACVIYKGANFIFKSGKLANPNCPLTTLVLPPFQNLATSGFFLSQTILALTKFIKIINIYNTK